MVRLWFAWALLLLPSATACSLAYMPYDQATWESDLHYVDASSLHRVRSGLDTVLVEGFFLTYATHGDLLLVGGQDGLGAGCEGEGWLRLWRDGQELWSRDGHGRVFPHEAGPIAVHDGKAWRLQGEELVSLDAQVPSGAHISGWTTDSRPVYRGDGVLVVGNLSLPRQDIAMFEPAVARSPSATGLAFFVGGKTTLMEVQDGTVRSRQWATAEDYRVQVAWAEGWYVLSGGRVYHVGEKVSDLGMEALALGTRGGQAVVFTEEGYTVFEGTRAVESARKAGSAWLPDPRPSAAVARDVQASPWTGETADTSNPPDPKPSPMSLPVVAIGLALVAFRRRYGIAP